MEYSYEYNGQLKMDLILILNLTKKPNLTVFTFMFRNLGKNLSFTLIHSTYMRAVVLLLILLEFDFYVNQLIHK